MTDASSADEGLMGASIRVMTYNVLYGGVGREARIRDVIADIRPDVAVFNEVTDADSFDTIASAVGPHVAGRLAGRGSAYSVIVSRWPLTAHALFGPPWSRRKWVEATAAVPGGRPLTVRGVHFTPHPLWPFELCRVVEAGALLRRLRSRAETDYVVAGDFNALGPGDPQRADGAPPWVRAQWLAQGGVTPRWAMSRLARAGLVDCYRACHAASDGFTVPAWSPGARIDYILGSPGLRRRLRGADVHGAPRASPPARTLAQLLGWAPTPLAGGTPSDHLPVWADFEWTSGGSDTVPS